MGLWLLQESHAHLGEARAPGDLHGAAGRGRALPSRRTVVDADDPVFLPPGDMPARIAADCRATGQPVPAPPAALIRCILDSLAARPTARASRDAVGSPAAPVDVVHVVGGGSATSCCASSPLTRPGCP